MRIRTLAIGAAGASAIAVARLYKGHARNRRSLAPSARYSRSERRALARKTRRLTIVLASGTILAFPSLGDVMGGIGSFFGSTLGELKDWVVGFVTDVWDAIMYMFDLLDMAVDWGFGQFIGSINAVFDVVSDVVEEMAGFAQGIWRVVDEAVLGSLSVIYGYFDAVWQFMEQFGGNALDFVTGVAEDVFSALWNIAIEPVWRAIQDIAGWTWEQIEPLVMGLIEAAIDAIDFAAGTAEAIVREGLSLIFDLGFDIFEVFVKLLEWGWWIITHPEDVLAALAEETVRWARPQIEQMITDTIRDNVDGIESLLSDLFGV